MKTKKIVSKPTTKPTGFILGAPAKVDFWSTENEPLKKDRGLYITITSKDLSTADAIIPWDLIRKFVDDSKVDKRFERDDRRADA